MKILKILLISILSILILILLAIVLFIKSFDANQYLPQITQQISQLIHRKVTIDRIGLNFNFTKGVSFNLTSLLVEDDPQFSKESFLTINAVYAGLDIRALLFERKIFVSNLVIDTPKVSIIRSADGQINAQTMGSAPNQNNSQAIIPQPQKNETTNKSSTGTPLPEISIKSISIKNGQFYFIDQNIQTPIHFFIENVEANVTNFSLSQPFDFNLNLNVYARGNKNTEIVGRSRLDLIQNSVQITDLNIKSDFDQWDWNKVRIIPILKSLPVWPQEIKGRLLMAIPELKVSSKGLEKISLEIDLTNGFLKFKELSNPIKNINLKILLDLNDLSLNTLKANIGTGEITAQGKVKSFTTTPIYDFQLKTKGMKIEELLDQNSWPTVLKGSLTGQFSGSGEGFEPEVLLKNLQGTGNFQLLNAKIEKLNLLKAILDKLNFIPGLSAKIESSLSSKVHEKLNSDTTILNKVEAKIVVQNKIININTAEIESNMFLIQAQGSMDFDMFTNIDVNTYIDSDLSEDLVKSVNTLQGLLDGKKRLFIPGKISGKAPSIGYTLLVDDITKRAVLAEGSQQLEKILDKNPKVKNILNSILGGDSTKDESSQIQPMTNSESQPQEKSSQELINDIFGAFSKKKKE